MTGGGLETAKQSAFHVELIGREIATSSRFTEEKAQGLLRDVLSAIESRGDIGFTGFHCESTLQSERQAAELLSQAHEAFAKAARQ